MIILKFRPDLIESILKGKKTTTWRLFDEKSISKGDNLSLVNWETGKEFAQGRITSVVEKRFGEIKPEDYEGHEKYRSDAIMYQQYSEYYHKKINEYTGVKIIKFKLSKYL